MQASIVKRERLLGLIAFAIAAIVVHPLLGRGFALSYDMVFVPSPAATPSLFGRGPELPRSVPSDLIVALGSWLVGGELMQRFTLLLVLAAAGWGAGRLVRGPLMAQSTATLFAMWNPWVAERLAIGQWALLIGYAAMPWCVAAVIAAVHHERRALPRLVLCLAAAAVGGGSAALVATGTTGVAALVACGRALARQKKVLVVLFGSAMILNAPWWFTSLLRPLDLNVDPASVSAFAARGEAPLGLALTLLTGGGIWNSDVVPSERGSAVAFVAVALAAVAAVGAWCQHRAGNRAIWPLSVAAIVGVILCAALTAPGGFSRTLVTAVPGGGLFRDSHKLVAPLLLATAVGLGGAVASMLGSRGRLRELAVPATSVLVLSIPLCLPSLALGLAGRLDPVSYPADYASVATLLQKQATAADVAVVLPWQPYRAYKWTDRRTLLAPLPRWLPTTTVIDDDLPVGGRVVAGEGPLSARLDPLLSRRAPLRPGLASLGVRWVLVERRTGTPPVPAETLRGLRVAYSGTDLVLLRVPDVERGAGARFADPIRPPLAVVAGTDVLAAGFLVGAFAALLRTRWKRSPGPGVDGPHSTGVTATL